jgi:hypothetical protein
VALEVLLRDLQRAGIDAQKYLSLQGQVSKLKPVSSEKKSKVMALDVLRSERTALLFEKETLRAVRIKSLTAAARRISKELKNLVRVDIVDGNERSNLTKTHQAVCSGAFRQDLQRD